MLYKHMDNNNILHIYQLWLQTATALDGDVLATAHVDARVNINVSTGLWSLECTGKKLYTFLVVNEAVGYLQQFFNSFSTFSETPLQF